MSGTFLVNDSEEVKDCPRREPETLMAVEPHALTGVTEVEQNRFPVISGKCLCSQ